MNSNLYWPPFRARGGGQPRIPRLVLILAALAALVWGLRSAGSRETAADPGRRDAWTCTEIRSALLQPNFGLREGDAVAELGDLDAWLTDGGGDDPEAAPANLSPDEWQTVTIGRGGSFYEAFQEAGFEHDTILDLVKACRPHINLRKVKRGDVFSICREDGVFEALRFDIDRERYLKVERGPDGLEADVVRHPIEESVRVASGVIHSNLFDALVEQHVDFTLADQMAEILGWDIDFFRDLRRGDRFTVLYREFRYQDRTVRDPEVLAVRFTNRGRLLRAYRFTDEQGLAAYYEADGSSHERQFLRAPLKYTRISSGFSHRRLHPVLHTRRPHYGVDFVAAPGTPVMATADGVVIRRSYDHASGNCVGIRHGNGYESYYLHLSRYARNIAKGKRVRQGDVIGYVGQTGWATGPHLDYRIKKNGTWVNPTKLSLPPAAPLAKERMPEFLERVALYDGRMEAEPAESATLALDGGD